MQPVNPKIEALLKFSLLQFVKSSNEAGYIYFMENGQQHLVDQEIKDAAKEAYENNKIKKPSCLFNEPASQIYYKILSLPGPIANTAKKR